MALVFCVDGYSNGRRNRGKLLACLGCSDSKFSIEMASLTHLAVGWKRAITIYLLVVRCLRNAK